MTHPWQPSASLATLRQRADIMQHIRHFFAERNILEVETPLLSHTTVTDPHIESIPVIGKGAESSALPFFYLQTSPEYAMKRLLAAGSGPIYQITKAFRQGEQGRWHNPEFTMLEWYRLDFNHLDLIQEMADFLKVVLNISHVDQVSYADVFKKYLTIDPHQATLLELQDCATQHALLGFGLTEEDRNFWLDLLFSHCIEPHLGQDRPLFVFDYPSSQAALAQLREVQGTLVASRFEMYFKGIEIANGFHELQDPVEQRKRFVQDLACRQQKQLAAVPLDEHFLAALAHGLPNCAGVAVGIDRLIMLSLGHDTIDQVLSFSFDQA